MRARFQERVKELVDINAPNIWNAFKKIFYRFVMKYVCRKKSRKKHGDT